MRLLFIDDNEDDALLAVAALKRAGFSFEPRVLSSIEQLEPALREGTWDAVISDYNLGGATGLDVLRLVRKEIAADIPFLLVSGTIGDERSAEAIRAGVHDYISKDRLARLPGALQRELDAARDRDARRALEASLAEAQERYRQTFEQAPIGIAHSDRNARLLCVNERYATLLGHAATDLIGACWLDFLAPDDVGISLNEYQAFFDDAHTPSVFEGRYVRKDGTVVWANVTATVMRDSNGEAGYVIALVEDITAQKKAKEKLLMQSRLLECVEQAVIATDLNGRITFWNGVAEVMYGWTAEETLGAPVVEITAAPESDEQAAAILARLVRGESWMGEIVLARRDGSTFPALVVSSPMLDEAGKLIGVVGVSHDLTQQQNVQNELRAHKLQLAAAQEIARVGSWTYDFATGHRQWSEGLCRLTGLEPDARGSLDPIFDLIHPDDRARIRDLQRMSHDQLEPVSTEFRIVRGGAERTIMMRTRYVFGAQRQPLKIIGVVQDVTEEREREEELRRRTIQQSAVANLGQIALTGASIDFLLEQAASAVHLVLEVERSSIFRQDGEDLLLLAGEGWPARELRVARLAPTGEPLRDELFTGNGLHGGTTVPIYSADGTEWGILGVHTRQERVFAAHDVEFLRSIATLIGQAMDRALADLELTTRARQQSAIAKLGRLVLNALDTEVFDRACELLMLGAGVDFVFFNEVTSANTLRRRAGTVWSSDLPTEIPIAADTHAGQTLLTRQPIVVDDYATETRFRTYEATVPYGIRSGAMVPVTSGAQTFGVLSAQSRTPRHFRTDDVDFLETVANILAEAIERELARQVIEESEHRYRRIVDGATEIIFTIDAQGRLVALNAAFETITGWSRNEWLGRPFVDVIVPEDRERLQQLFTKMLTSARAAHTEMTLQGKDRRVHIDVSSFPKAEGGTVSEVYGFARDITETRRVTEERERVTRNLQLLLESTVEGIFTIDRAGRGTMVNRAAAAFLQRTPEELLGQPMHDLLHPCSTREQCSILRVLETGEAATVNSDTFSRGDETPLPVAYSAAPIIDEGQHVGVVVTFTDLSERRKLEARLEQANRLSSLGRLAATVAHEFNNVLMGIAPFVEVVRRAPSPQKVATSLDHIANSVKRGRRITQDILRFTQPAEPVRARVDLESWMHAVSMEARSLLSTIYDIHIDVEPLSVEGDANQLHQIFVNLILNARDAMPSGGTIRITARREPRDARFPFAAPAEPDGYVHFLISDTGCGMSEETLRHALEPLFTTKKSGTGLGLAVTHQVVLRHGGEIFIESAVGEGTTFHLFLPLAPEAKPAPSRQEDSEPAGARATRHILLVEDDSTVAMGLMSLLEFEGYTVSRAETGAAALAKVREEQFDAVLLDVGLPDMDGKAVFVRMRELSPHLPVVFSTGHADRGGLEELLDGENVSFLLKPYESDSLMETLARVMSAAPAGQRPTATRSTRH